jgi:hypothetical protein
MSYEIVIEHTEDGDCACHDCSFAEKAGSHVAVQQMRTDAAQHVYATGHTVDEHVGYHTVVHPRSAVNY